MIRRPFVAFALLSVLLVAVFFHEAVWDGRVLSQADILYQFSPWSAHRPDEWMRPGNPLLGDIPMLVHPYLVKVTAALREGRLPLWDAGTYAGHPLLASYQSAVFSPFTWMALLAPLPWVTVLMAGARLLVGGLGMFLFVRALGLRPAAQLIAGLVYLLNPFSVVWLEHHVAAVAAWLPWLLLVTERAIARPTPDAGAAREANRPRHRAGRRVLDLAALAVVTALVLLAGHPETSFKVILAGGVYALFRLSAVSHISGRGLRPRVTLLTLVLTGYLAGLLLAAVQILPFLEYLGQSREPGLRAAWNIRHFTAPLGTLVTAFVPDFHGNPLRGTYAGPSNYCEQQVYAGIAIWLLAAVGFWTSPERRKAWFFAVAGVAAGLVMYGAPGILQIVSSLPVLRITMLSRFGLLVITAAVILAAYGVSALVADGEPRSPRRLWLPALVTALAIIGVVAWSFRGAAEDPTLEEASRGAAIALAIGALTLALVIARARRALSPRVFTAGLALVVVADLFLFGRGFHPLVPPAWVFPRVPEIETIRRDPDVFRVAGWGVEFIPNTALAYGLQDFRGYDAIGVGRYAELLEAACENQYGFQFNTHWDDPRLMDLLSVKYVVMPLGRALDEPRYTRLPGAAPIFRNNRALPRALLVDGYRVMTGNEARRTLRDEGVDYRRVVLLDADPPAGARPDPAEDDAAGTTTIRRYEDQTVEIETAASGRRLLVLTDVFYPGWTATIDGRPAPIFLANFAFRAVPVPPGRHIVRFTYRPWSFRAGAWISLATLLALALAVSFERTRYR